VSAFFEQYQDRNHTALCMCAITEAD